MCTLRWAAVSGRWRVSARVDNTPTESFDKQGSDEVPVSGVEGTDLALSCIDVSVEEIVLFC